jgi:hypothetical protein
VMPGRNVFVSCITYPMAILTDTPIPSCRSRTGRIICVCTE